MLGENKIQASQISTHLFIIVFSIFKCPEAIPWENHRGDERAAHIRGWTCLGEKKISRLLLITSSDDGDEDFSQRWAYGSWQVCDGELSGPEVHSSSSSARQGENVFDCMFDNSSQTARFTTTTRSLYITAVGFYLVVNCCELRKSLLK